MVAWGLGLDGSTGPRKRVHSTLKIKPALLLERRMQLLFQYLVDGPLQVWRLKGSRRNPHQGTKGPDMNFSSQTVHPSEEQSRKPLPAAGWSDEEELVIVTIQQAESVPRAEAIRRMQRRKKASRSAAGSTGFRREGVLGPGRLCRNPRCTRGDDGGPGSLAHLRADALYCDDACRMAAQRSPNRPNRPSNRQCLCGFKANKSGSLVPPHQPEQYLVQNACNRNRKFLRRTETVVGSTCFEKEIKESR